MELSNKKLAVALFQALKNKTFRRLGWYPRRTIRKNPIRPFSMVNTTIFAEFITDDGRKLCLYNGYRDRIKSNWRLNFWPTIALMSIKDRIPLNAEAKKLINLLNISRTLPAALDEFASVVSKLAKQYPKVLIKSDIQSPFSSFPVVAARLTDQKVEAVAPYYREYAIMVLQQFSCFSSKMDLAKMSVLEVDCGMGYAVVAMAALGVSHSSGIDSNTKDFRIIYEQPAVSRRLGDNRPDIAGRVQVINGNCTYMPYVCGVGERKNFDFLK